MPDFSNIGDALTRIGAATNGANSLADYDLKRKSLSLGLPGGDVPSAIQEYIYYNNLDDAGKANYMKIKRAQQIVNLGGTQGVLNPTGQGLSQQFQVTPKPEDMPDFKGQQAAATAAGQVQGQTQAEAAATLPDAMAQAQMDLEHIKQLKEHPGLEASVGLKGPSAILDFGKPVPGTAAADFQTLMDQIKGGTFLQAYKTLKGGGQITEIEGQKATDAIARLSTSQTEKEFKKALDEYQDVIQKGLDRFKAKAGEPSTPKRLKYNPATGRLE